MNNNYVNSKVCSCPYCKAEIIVSKDEAYNNSTIKCDYCRQYLIPYIDDENTIKIKKANEHTNGELNAKCSCPYCKTEIVVSKDEAHNNSTIKCDYCRQYLIPYIDDENTIKIKKANEHTNGELNAKCSCPYCKNEIIISKDEAYNNSTIKCDNCKQYLVPYIDDQNTIKIKKVNEHTNGELNAKCSCPYCKTEIIISKDEAYNNSTIKCESCKQYLVPYIDDEKTIKIKKANEHTNGELNAKCSCPYCKTEIIISKDEAYNNSTIKCESCKQYLVPYIDDNNIINIKKENITLEKGKKCNCPNCSSETLIQIGKDKRCESCNAIILTHMNPDTGEIELATRIPNISEEYYCKCPECNGGNILKISNNVNNCMWCNNPIYNNDYKQDTLESQKTK